MDLAPIDDSEPARLAARFAHLAGSLENAMALVLALHHGAPVKLANDSAAAAEVIALTPPTAAMPWSEVRTTLLNVQDALVRARILRPTLEQLLTALVGGELATANSRMPTRGVLAMRAAGLSWLDIARTTTPLQAGRSPGRA